eukprot:4316654-Ditylum_brightwellii.AAC.1
MSIAFVVGKRGGVFVGCRWVGGLCRNVVTSESAWMFKHASRGRSAIRLSAARCLWIPGYIGFSVRDTAAELSQNSGGADVIVMLENFVKARRRYNADRIPDSSVLYDVIKSLAPSQGPWSLIVFSVV